MGKLNLRKQKVVDGVLLQLCACGYCKIYFVVKPNSVRKFATGHQFKGVASWNKGNCKVIELHPCACGCGELCSGTYKHGHSARVIHWSKGHNAQEIKDKISSDRIEGFASGRLVPPMKDKHHSEETREKQSLAKEGYIPWNKGKHGYFTPEAIEAISAGRKGKSSWNKGLKGYFSPEALAKISRKDSIQTEESRLKTSSSLKVYYEDPFARLKASMVGRGIKKPDSFCEKMSERMSGPENPWYVDGRCSGLNNEYPQDWKGKLKEAIRDRDNHICQICGKTEQEAKKQLDVHHVDYEKKNLDPMNLISLCHSCHMKTNYNRTTWQAKLEEYMLSHYSATQVPQEVAVETFNRCGL